MHFTTALPLSPRLVYLPPQYTLTTRSPYLTIYCISITHHNIIFPPQCIIRHNIFVTRIYFSPQYTNPSVYFPLSPCFSPEYISHESINIINVLSATIYFSPEYISHESINIIQGLATWWHCSRTTPCKKDLSTSIVIFVIFVIIVVIIIVMFITAIFIITVMFIIVIIISSLYFIILWSVDLMIVAGTWLSHCFSLCLVSLSLLR